MKKELNKEIAAFHIKQDFYTWHFDTAEEAFNLDKISDWFINRIGTEIERKEKQCEVLSTSLELKEIEVKDLRELNSAKTHYISELEKSKEVLRETIEDLKKGMDLKEAELKSWKDENFENVDSANDALKEKEKEIENLKEELRISNMLREPNNPLFWSPSSNTDFFKNKRPANDNFILAERTKKNNESSKS